MKHVLLFFAVSVITFYNCAGKQPAKKLFVSGIVMRSDSSHVSGATIRTNPATAIAQTRSDGSFQILVPVPIGKYEFVADYNGEEGRANVFIKPGSSFVVVFIGRSIDLDELPVNQFRQPARGAGVKRTDK